MKVSNPCAVWKVLSSPVVKSKELLLLEPSSESQKYFSWTKLPQLWMKTLRKKFNKLCQTRWKVELRSLLLTEWVLLRSAIRFSSLTKEKWKKKEISKSFKISQTDSFQILPKEKTTSTNKNESSNFDTLRKSAFGLRLKT